MGQTDSPYSITTVTADTAAGAANVFRAIYGESFPMRYVYHADQLMAEIEGGRLCAALAFDQGQEAIGYASVYRNAPNPLLWEGGNLVLIPGRGDDRLGWSLMEYFKQPGKLPGPPPDGYYSESVCHHYFTQVGCAKLGFHDCAIELDQLDGASFAEHRPSTDRVACVLQFYEQTGQPEPVCLPHRYADLLQRLAQPLQPRKFLTSSLPLPEGGATASTSSYYESSRTWKLSVNEVGADWGSWLDKLLAEAHQRRVVSLQVVVSMAVPCIGAAVEAMRERGFSLGGLFPRWFGADGIMLQQVLGKEPDYEGIKLYSQTARGLLGFIRDDQEAAKRRQTR
ncbi:MAG: hypothetical protein Q8O35_13780 [Humidesulfovibrio sp.]|uniref:hypothetical protein n=1 Tax=Humidesulfovibrio sp. TaxID=2910988 RepID=UPI0027323840|nr:hypothetical protein [Humidesulfovibrio sp.]MDP2849238.1 hypothetical protein [Humidesulfovibrio sp.]